MSTILKSFWKYVAFVLCLAILCGFLILWHSYRRHKDRKDAEQVGVLLKLAEQGDLKAQYRLGLLYYEGKGVPQNNIEAIHWYRDAAERGDPKSQYAIGYMYETGKGVKQDFGEAAIWYRKSADQGDAQAQCGLGSMYYDGRGVEQDRSEAARWYRKAADQGISRAEYDLGYMYYYGQGVPEDSATANYWYGRAADRGDVDAQHTLGVGLTPWRMLILLALLIGGILLTAGLLMPRKVRWSTQTRKTTVAGVLCFFSAGLNWYGFTHYEARSGALSLLTWTLNGILLILLITVLREGIKVSVWMSRQ